MEAMKFKTVEDLLQSEDERVELINGEIVKRPMARSEHGIVQLNLYDGIMLFKHKSGSGGWWIISEVSVRYNAHQCPSHDLAGWRKERVSDRPTGVMDIVPDWVCEITSPGHEKKDTFNNFMLLQKYEVPYYWIIWPEDKALIAYKLVNKKYAVYFSTDCKDHSDFEKVRIEPFEEVETDLNYVFN